jgi:hypothetical protein
MSPRVPFPCLIVLAFVGCGGSVEVNNDNQGPTTPTAPPPDAGYVRPEAGTTPRPDANTNPPDANVASPEAATDAGTATPCPADIPTTAAACPSEGQICVFRRGKMGPCDDNGNDDTVVWRCDHGEWLEIAHCIDEAACPEHPPAEFSSCPSLGLDCFYSSDTCSASSTAQCAAEGWVYVNACEPRTNDNCLLLDQTLASDGELGIQDDPLDTHYIRWPVIAVAGTQTMMAWHEVSCCDNMGPYIAATRAQTAVPSMIGMYSGPAPIVGHFANSNPVLAFERDRFLLGWVVFNTLPDGSGGPSGLTVKRLWDPNQTTSDSEVLIDPGADAPTSLALGRTGGWIGFRSDAIPNSGIYKASIVALQSGDTPIDASKRVVTDQTDPRWNRDVDGLVPPATAQFVTGPAGFYLAYPSPAGDRYAGNEIAVSTVDWNSTTPQPTAMGPLVRPERFSFAALRDGSTAYAWVDASDTQTGSSFSRMICTGAVCELFSTQPATGTLGFGPKIIAVEEGYAVLWTTYQPGGEPIATLHIDLHSRTSVRTEFTRSIPNIAAEDWIGFAYGPVDRSLHIAWSPTIGRDPKGAHVYYQRLICSTVGIK